MSNSALFKVDVSGIDNKLQDDEMATGDLKYWPGQTAPVGWFVRDGRALSRTAYAALFAVLGTTYGAGDGNTTFNIPDDRGEFIRGADMGRGVDAGRVVGSFQKATATAADLGAAASDSIFGVCAKGSPTNAQAAAMLGGDLIAGEDYANVVISGLGGVFNVGFEAAGFIAVGSRPRNRAYIPLIKY